MRTLALDQHVAVVAGRDGLFLVNRNDQYVGRALEVYGEYGALESEFLKGVLRAGDFVVEVGANIGSHTVGFARHVGPSGQVHAFEPQRACYALLQAQLALNRLGNVVAHNKALGSHPGELWVPAVNYDAPGNFGGVSLDASEGQEKVVVDTLDAQFADSDVRFIKADVEGMEREVLEGGRALIARVRPLLYVENDRVDRSPALLELLFGMGYRVYWHIPPLFNPGNYFGVTENIYGNVASFNLFCVHDSWDSTAAVGLREVRSGSEPHPLAPPAGVR